MAESFEPEEFKVRGADGQENFADIWALTQVQLGAVLLELDRHHESLPAFRPEDLVGYHCLQYRVDADIVRQTIRHITEPPAPWPESSPERSSADLLSKVLDEKARSPHARLGRILINREGQDYPTTDPAIDRLLFLSTRSDHEGRDIHSLYPVEEGLLHYLGRSSLHVDKARPFSKGPLTRGRVKLDNVRVHSDFVAVTNRGRESIVEVKSYEESGKSYLPDSLHVIHSTAAPSAE